MSWIMAFLSIVTGVFLFTVGLGEWRILVKPGASATFSVGEKQRYIDSAKRAVIFGIFFIVSGLTVLMIVYFL